MLDFTPLALQHASLASLAASLVALGVKFARLRLHRNGQTHYAGVVLISTITLLSLSVIESTSLRLGILGAAALTLLIGTLDEVFKLSAGFQFVAQLMIASLAVLTGWVIPYVTNPFGDGVLYLAAPGVLTVLWLVFLMNSLNWLDGADGLAPGVASVALLTLAAVSLLPATQDRTTLGLAVIGVGATAAFLLWNWPPARIYLGTSGSWWLGLYLGLTAIIGGGKVATTLLVLALPALDAVLVTLQRVLTGKPPWQGDTSRHLHYRLKAAGWSSHLLVVGALGLTALLGVGAVVLQTRHKLLALIVVAGLLSATSLSLWRQQRLS